MRDLVKVVGVTQTVCRGTAVTVRERKNAVRERFGTGLLGLAEEAQVHGP